MPWKSNSPSVCACIILGSRSWPVVTSMMGSNDSCASGIAVGGEQASLILRCNNTCVHALTHPDSRTDERTKFIPTCP